MPYWQKGVSAKHGSGYGRAVLEALKGVSDPDKGADIVSLGMVSGVVVQEGNVGFSIEVDPERGPQLEPLRKAAEAAVDNLSGVLSVTAVLTAGTGSAEFGWRGRWRSAAAQPSANRLSRRRNHWRWSQKHRGRRQRQGRGR